VSGTSRALPGALTYAGRTVWLKYHALLSGTHPFPANSLAALRALLDGGAEVIEFDVGFTRDGGFALLHDPTLDRETTGMGPLRALTREEVRHLRLRGTTEPVATLDEVTALLGAVGRPLKVQVDLKAWMPLTPTDTATFLEAIAPLRANPALRVVVGCLADWNLRRLRRWDRDLVLGLDFSHHLDAPVDAPLRLPTRVNAYGYLDDHPLGFRRWQPVAAYLEDRVEGLLDLLPDAAELYLRKELLLQAAADGVDVVALVRRLRPDVLVDVWTLNAGEPGWEETLRQVLGAGVDQLTTDTAPALAEAAGTLEATQVTPAAAGESPHLRRGESEAAEIEGQDDGEAVDKRA
jgi:glycerophosphoryl diester phosphodiesterase